MDLNQLEADRKLARMARRKPMNEAGLVWSLVGIAFYLLVFALLKEYPSIPIPFGLSFTGACVIAGILGGGVVALVYLAFARRVVEKARGEFADYLHRAQAAQRADVESRMRSMEEK